MKIETMIFGIVGLFFLPVAIVYGFMTQWTEWVGVIGASAGLRCRRSRHRKDTAK
ncbi:hypothetical protein CTI14_65990 [Methylobacterium radiotolerans]|nr:hypothetical protein CTI14_65990 [Methylobacterium radiotolerans]